MSKNPNMPMSKNVVGDGASGKTAHAARGQGFAKMKVGTPSCLGDRAGRFKGTASDLRTTKGKFSSGIPAQDSKRGSDTRHASQPKGHKSLAKGAKW